MTDGDPASGADEPRGLLIPTEAPAVGAAVRADVRHAAEAVLVSRGGGVLILGWVDDAARPLEAVTLAGPGWRVTLDAASLLRRARPDVAEALGQPAGHPYGYLGFVFGDREIRGDGPCDVHLRFRDGGRASATRDMRPVDDEALRVTLLSHVPAPSTPGAAGAFASLDHGLGDQIVRFNRALTARVVGDPWIERFGGGRACRGSIVVCLYGRPEYQFVQNALFSAGEGIGDYEFVFVCNSPELAEGLLGDARKSHRIYGLDQTVVLLPGNAGFGAANNLAVRSARAGRVLIVNPDVLPKDPAWARKHGELLDARAEPETRLFGAALYYDDGSLMHGGMYFELDADVAVDGERLTRATSARIEHYGKGAPAGSPRFTRPRPVPAVTGAFISVDRPWFEHLGGFNEDYVLGHYEDADLCLTSLQAGVPAWLHDLRFWHLEGKGSTHERAHEGAALVNRWLFTARWREALDGGLLGPHPAHPLLQDAPA